MSQDFREDNPYLCSGYMIVDKRHTHANQIQESHMNVVGKLRSVVYSVARKALLTSSNPSG